MSCALLFSILTETLLNQGSEADLLRALARNSRVANSVVDNKWATHVRKSKRLLDPGYSEFGLVRFQKCVKRERDFLTFFHFTLLDVARVSFNYKLVYLNGNNAADRSGGR